MTHIQIFTISRNLNQFILKDMQQESIFPEKSPNDERIYEAVELPNRIKLLFVHDDKAQKGACSISVGVGSLKDGERSLGLAHFLEHMLFMGSRKFPRHNEYSEFISLNSGMDNAWTSDEETNYYFEIANDKFLEGVERITDFFVDALLTETCIEKERQAVHQECQLRCGEDNSRKWEILKHFASGPYRNHSIGNNETLSHPLVGQDLREFYQREYSANRINAVLLSALPIEEMRARALPLFAQIVDKQLPNIDYELHFQAQNIGKMVRMKSIKDESILEFFWIINSLRPAYKVHPEKYIGHVLGHEGRNSLLSVLKEKEYASKISSYNHDMPKQSIVGLEIQLTESGAKEYEKVYNLVCDYCCSLKADSNIYNEIKEASVVAFQFREKSPNFSYATDLCSTMHRIPLPQVISYRAHYADFDQQLIDSFLNQLNPFNLVLFYSNSDELDNPLTEKYLGGTFVDRDLPKRVNQSYAFSPLIKNPFLPLVTVLHPAEATNTNIIKQENIYFTRGTFQVCKGGIQLIVRSPESDVFLELYGAYLELLFKEITYEAESLRLQAGVDDEDFIKISLFGFSDTVEKLMKEIAPLLTTIHRGKNGQSLFDLTIENLQEQYENFYCGDVDEIADGHLNILLKNTSTTIENTLKVLEGYEYEDFCLLIDNFWRSAKLEWVVVGNFSKNILTTIKELEKLIHLQGQKNGKSELTCLKVCKNIVHTTQLEAEEIATSGCIKYHQVGPYSEPLYYLLTVLVNYIKEPFFDKLRTEKQLAYYLRAYLENIRGTLSLNFLLVSSNTPPLAISDHISQFCNNFLSEAGNDLTPEKLQLIKQSVRTKFLQPHNSLKDYFSFVCRQIDNQTFLFNRKEKECLEQYLSTITKEDVLNLFKKSLEKSLQIWIVAKNHQELNKGEKCEDMQSIKASGEYYAQWKNEFSS